MWRSVSGCAAVIQLRSDVEKRGGRRSNREKEGIFAQRCPSDRLTLRLHCEARWQKMKASYEGGSSFTSWNITPYLSSGIKLYRENLIHKVKLGWLRKFVVSDIITIFGQVRSQVFQIQLGYISRLDTISHTYI